MTEKWDEEWRWVGDGSILGVWLENLTEKWEIIMYINSLWKEGYVLNDHLSYLFDKKRKMISS